MSKTRAILLTVIAVFVAILVAECVLAFYKNTDFYLVRLILPPLLGMVTGWLCRKDQEERRLAKRSPRDQSTAP
jgi:hypothetical protein